MLKIVKWFRSLFSEKHYELKTTYLINGKEVDELTWYANGGTEIERRLTEIEEYIEDQRQW
jgi:hypothetical protein